MLRHSLYMIMNAIYHQTNTGNKIAVESLANGSMRFTITSGKIKHDMPDLSKDKFVRYAKTFVTKLHGKFTMQQTEWHLKFVVDIPNLPSH